MKRRKTMRYRAEPMVRPARKLVTRHPWMGALKGWLAQESELRWWNWNIRPGKYKPNPEGNT